MAVVMALNVALQTVADKGYEGYIKGTPYDSTHPRRILADLAEMSFETTTEGASPMSIASLRKPRRLHFTSYPDPSVPDWLIARIRFDWDGSGARLEFHDDLRPVDQLRAIAWAGAVLPHYLRLDGNGYAINDDSVIPTLPVAYADGAAA